MKSITCFDYVNSDEVSQMLTKFTQAFPATLMLCPIYYCAAATTLTGLHFATTTLLTVLLRWLGYIQDSYLPLPDLLKFVLFANFSIVGMNVSLMWNSVGFYQVSFGDRLLFSSMFDLLEVMLHFF